MTIAELIEQLKKYDPNRVVYYADHEYGPAEILTVDDDSSLLRHFKDLDKNKVIFLE